MELVFWLLCLLSFNRLGKGINIEELKLKEASDALVDIVHSDRFHALFQSDQTTIDGRTLLDHVKANTKLGGDDFEHVFAAMVGKSSASDLVHERFTWEQATMVINGLIKLSENISVNESRKPNSKYRYEDERITAAKERRKQGRNAKEEL